MNNNRQKLIQAICCHDMIAIHYYLDDRIMHTGLNKIVFEKSLEYFFDIINQNAKQ